MDRPLLRLPHRRQPDAGAPPRGPVRLISWNIHGGVGRDGVYDLDRVIALVARHDPDVVSLQEVDTRGRAGKLERLVAALGGHVEKAHTVRSPDGDYGHVLISRWPLAMSRLHDISMDGREPRAAIETTVVTPFGPLHVISVHLGLNLWERRRQAEKLRAIAEDAEAPVGVAVGDFNDWARPGPVQRLLARPFPRSVSFRSYPAGMPLFHLDRLYCRPAAALLSARVDLVGRIASDHLPLIVELDPAAGRGSAG